MSLGESFPRAEYAARIDRVRGLMARRGLDACLIVSPENIYYLTGLDHQGYFATHILIVPVDEDLALVSRAMERAIVRDTVPDVRHIGYADGIEPLPPPKNEAEDIVIGTAEHAGPEQGLRPWETSIGMVTREPAMRPPGIDGAARATLQALTDAGLRKARLGLEQSSCFLTYRTAREIVEGLPSADWKDCSGLIEDCRLIQSPNELQYTRKAAEVSDAMMLSAIAAAGPGVEQKDIAASVYQAMFQRGGKHPGFIPLIRSTRTLEHEHATWQRGRLRRGDLLFLELAGCVQRYHAPMGRLIFIEKAPKSAERMNQICMEAIAAAAESISPGVAAKEVYAAWHGVLKHHGLLHYRRHHCGYAVGIGFPPSWSGSGVPIGLREDSEMILRPGMVFHLMSWLLRTGKGDSFLSDTVVVSESGCEILTKTSREVMVR